MDTVSLIGFMLLLSGTLSACRFSRGRGFGPAGGLRRIELMVGAPVARLRWTMSRVGPVLAVAVSDPPTSPLEVPPSPITPEAPAHPVTPPPSENPVPVREPPEVKPPVAAHTV